MTTDAGITARHLIRRTAHILFPGVCPGCRRDLAPEAQGPACLPCLRRFTLEEKTDHDMGDLDGFFFAADYQGPPARIIRAFKYQNRDYIGRAIGRLMATRWENPPTVNGVVPVPSSAWKTWRRGFNPAAVIAREVARRWQVPCETTWLTRRLLNRSQTRLSREGRRRNAAAGFSLRSAPVRLSGRRLLLVDDVGTTGATLETCAVLLKRGGAEWVGGAVAAWERCPGAARIDEDMAEHYNPAR